MTRSLSTEMATAATANVVRPVLFARLDFASGMVRACSCDRQLTTPSGEMFYGVGNFAGVSEVKEDVQLGANGISLTLSGVDTNLISTALQEDYQGRSAALLVGLCDDSWQLVAEPTLVFSGRMDTMSISSGESGTIQLSCENRLAAWDKSRSLRYNAETQKLLYPEDRGFEFVEQTAERQVYWGMAKEGTK